MVLSVALTVYGTPAPKGSRTLGLRGDGSAFSRPASNREHTWTEAVARHAQWLKAQPVDAPNPPYAVTLTFYLARPKRPVHGYPSRVDVDKLARAVLDGLVVGGLLEDDRHVTELVASKRWAETPAGQCCRVEVASADELSEAA